MTTKNVGFIKWLALSFLLGSSPAWSAVVSVGNVTGVTVSTNGSTGNITASFALSTGGAVAITPFAPDVVRVDFHWVGAFDTDQPMIAKPFTNWPAVTASLSDLGSSYLLQTAELDVEIIKSPLKVHFKDKSGFYLLQDDHMEFDSAYNYTGQRGTSSSKLKCQKVMPARQAYFGLSEFGGPMNRRGQEIDCWNSGTYNWGEYQNPTYLNIPFFYGVQPATNTTPAFVYGVFFNNPCRPLFKFGTQAGDKYSFEASDGRMDYFFIGGGNGHSMARVIDRYSELTGRPTMLPKWGLGHHLSRFSYDSQSWIEYIANQATVDDFPLDAVYLDIDYMDADADGDYADGLLHQLTLNSKFANPAGMVSYCNTRGVKVVPLIEPWLEPGDASNYNEANSNLHFIKDNGGSTVTRNIYVGAVSWFDFSSTPMNEWWQSRIISWFNGVGFSGIWNDLTEPEGGDAIPHDALLWIDGKFGTSTTDSRRYWSNERNYFGLRTARQSYNTMLAKDSNQRPFVLSRSGNAGLQRYGVSWSGDTRANWFYQRATIRFGMGAMIAGAAWYGNDVGGFAGTATPELMVRSIEFNCLTPFFRNHCDKAAADREPWRFSEPYKSQMRDLIKMRYKLMPYLYTLAYESTQTGEPMNVPPVFDYFADANTHSLSDYEFLVGDFILAAPVYNEGATTRTTYLPYAGGVEWYYWPSGQPSSQPSGDKYGGGQQVTVSAPLGKMPMFVRSGAIIPMGPSMQFANQIQAGWMDINCWPQGDSEFTLHEDDGETWDYLGGEYARRRMVSHRTASAWEFTIEAKQGTYNTGTRDFYVYCFNPGTSTVHGVTLNGAPMTQLANFDAGAQGWLITAEGRIGIKLPDTGAVAALRVSFAEVSDSVQFTSSTAIVAENGGSVRLQVSRSGSATGAVNVLCAAAGGSATAGSDFIATNAMIHWAAGDLTNKYFDIQILDDSVYEATETFSVSLSAATGADLGSPSLATVTITDNDPLPPDLLVTNPPGTLAVSESTTTYDLQGVANAFNWVGLIWSNSLTGDSGQAPMGLSWSIAGVGLGVGTNLITVTATNVGGPIASDSASEAAYSDGWDTNDNGGFGWGEWRFSTSSATPSENGRFIASSAAVDIGTPAWGLYANNGNLSEAKRLLADTLTVGQTVAVRMDNGFINAGSGVGIALLNTSGTKLWEFFFNGGDTYYSMSGSTTDVGWTSTGLDVSFTLSGPTSYVARITPAGGITRTNRGSLITAANNDITIFRAWNYNAGSGSDYDFFFNNLTLSGSGGSGPSTSVVVQIVRSGTASQIPQAWRDRFDLAGVNSGDDEDADGDGRGNLEEYWADTNPTNGGAFFGEVTMQSSNAAAGMTMILEVAPPTTNSRLYDVSYGSNLVDGLWWPFGFNVPGRADGGGLIFTITNHVQAPLNFRTRVFMP
ncbi:MAG: TIM-barrel domain-containing protein [Lentisphaerota bacterium]